MVTMTLDKLLEHKRIYAEQWPGGFDSMDPEVQTAYKNLLREIKEAGKRCQMGLPGLDALPPPMTEGQPGLL